MKTRRQVIKEMGVGATLLMSTPYLNGCDGNNPVRGSGLDWRPLDQAPVLPGDTTEPWWLRGNYSPIEAETEFFDLEVIGSIPPELEGTFLRNGPNPYDAPSGHWFFGDGMLHAVEFADGRAISYKNRYINTIAFQEKFNGILGNRGNTAVVYHGDRLLTLYEGGAPHQVSLTDLTTMGEYHFGDQLLGPMGAHPRIDPVSDELWFIGYSPAPPYLRYTVVDSQGQMLRSEAIDIPAATMMHDCQLTADNLVIFDFPVAFDLSLLSDGGFPIEWRPQLGSRIGLMPRSGSASDIRWFEVNNSYMFHSFNAYTDGEGRTVIEGCRYSQLWGQGPADFSSAGTIWRWTIDPVSGTVSEGPIEDVSMEFPVIDARKQGMAHRYNFGLLQRGATPEYPVHPYGIAAIDRQTGRVDQWEQGHAVQPDEALFIPASPDSAEGEGYLMSVIYDRREDRSEVAILNAQDVSKGPIARVKLPRRVPFGFHGTWIPKAG